MGDSNRPLHHTSSQGLWTTPRDLLTSPMMTAQGDYELNHVKFRRWCGIIGRCCILSIVHATRLLLEPDVLQGGFGNRTLQSED